MVTGLLSAHLDTGYPSGNFWHVLVSVLMLIAVLLGYIWKHSAHGEMEKILSFCTSGKYGLGSSFVLVSAAAGNKSAMRPPLPPPRCGGEWKENRQKTDGLG